MINHIHSPLIWSGHECFHLKLIHTPAIPTPDIKLRSRFITKCFAQKISMKSYQKKLIDHNKTYIRITTTQSHSKLITFEIQINDFLKKINQLKNRFVIAYQFQGKTSLTAQLLPLMKCSAPTCHCQITFAGAQILKKYYDLQKNLHKLPWKVVRRIESSKNSSWDKNI